MKYPYIGKCEENELTVIFSDNGSGTTIDEGKSDVAINGKFECGFNEREFKNITTKYLANTYGEVKSKEHAEFIVKLATNHGLRCNRNIVDDDFKYFYFNDDVLFLTTFKLSPMTYFKQITIPLPPKEYLMEFEGREDELSKGDEWPKVGGDVLIHDLGFERNTKGTYKGENKNGVPIIELDDGSVFLLGFGGSISKPKTPEQELRDEISDLAFNQFNDDSYDLTHNSYYLAEQLISKYDITKKPQ